VSHLCSVPHGGVDVGVPAAVGERVRRDVQDTDDKGAVACAQQIKH
jgi:hypothetical protein